MWMFSCSICGGYLAHDYNIEDRMYCTKCFAVFTISITLTDHTVIDNKNEQGEYDNG